MVLLWEKQASSIGTLPITMWEHFKDQYGRRYETKSGTRQAQVPLRSLLPSAPPKQGALYPFGGLEVSGLLVTTRTMVTEDWGGFWSTWMGWTWPVPPGTKARAFPGPEGRTVGWGGAAMMTGWALTGEPARTDTNKNAVVYKSHVCICHWILCVFVCLWVQPYLGHSGSTYTQVQMLVC